MAYIRDRQTKSAFDANGDTRPDQWEFYGQEGGLERVETDSNSDGKPDQWAYYKNEKFVKSELDTNFDGKVDRREVYR